MSASGESFMQRFKNSVRVSVVATLAMVALPAAAADGRLTVGVSAGTYGIGPELAYRANTHVGMRLSGGFFSRSQSLDADDIDYDARLKLNSIGVALDLYPFRGGFRVSAGGRINNNRIGLLGNPKSSVEIGDVMYTPAQVGTLAGTVQGKRFAPTLTIGYGGKLAPGFVMGFELGVMTQGAPQIDQLRSTGGTLSTNQAFLSELEKERRSAEDDIDSFRLWPVIQLHLLYRF
jgi:hypothetical protein